MTNIRYERQESPRAEMGIDPIMQKQRRLQKSQRVHYANLGNVFYNHLRCKRSTNREHFLKILLESWEMKKVAPPILFWCSLSAAAKNTRGSLASSMRGENAAKGDFQISGSTWPPDSHASKTPEGTIWATNHLAEVPQIHDKPPYCRGK